MRNLTPEMIENAKQMIVNLEVAKTMDRKNNTRRLPTDKQQEKLKEWKVEKSISSHNFEDLVTLEFESIDSDIKTFSASMKTKYQIGDILWVREPVKIISWHSDDNTDKMTYKYKSDGFENTMVIPYRLHKAFDYPKWITECQGIPNGCIKEMARTFSKVTNVRVERLQDITFEDIFKEGFDGEIQDYFITDSYKNKAITAKTPKELEVLNWWINLWDKTAPKGYKWEDNPYVFVYEFEKLEK